MCVSQSRYACSTMMTSNNTPMFKYSLSRRWVDYCHAIYNWNHIHIFQWPCRKKPVKLREMSKTLQLQPWWNSNQPLLFPINKISLKLILNYFKFINTSARIKLLICKELFQTFLLQYPNIVYWVTNNNIPHHWNDFH